MLEVLVVEPIGIQQGSINTRKCIRLTKVIIIWLSKHNQFLPELRERGESFVGGVAAEDKADCLIG